MSCDRCTRCVTWGLLTLWLGIAVAARAQSLEDNSRRIQQLEELHVEARVATIESRLGTIEMVLKGVFVLVGTQLALLLFPQVKKSGRNGD